MTFFCYSLMYYFSDNFWSPEGVISLSNNNGHVTCCATHMTHFAVVAVSIKMLAPTFLAI